MKAIDTYESTSRFTEINSITIHYNDVGNPQGKPAIFLHGGGPGCSSWSDFRDAALTLGADYRCLLVDLPQYGKSAKVPIQGGIFSFHAGIIAGLMDGLGVAQSYLVCQSFGGAVGIKLAVQSPERVLGLVITGSAPVGQGVSQILPQNFIAMEAVGGYYQGGASPEKMRTLLERYEWFDSSRIPEETIRLRYEASVQPDLMELWQQPGARGEMEDLTGVMHLNRAPTLILWGDCDRFSGMDVPLFMFTRFPNARLYVLKNASHHLQEEYPELYSRLVGSFLAELEAA